MSYNTLYFSSSFKAQLVVRPEFILKVTLEGVTYGCVWKVNLLILIDSCWIFFVMWKNPSAEFMGKDFKLYQYVIFVALCELKDLRQGLKYLHGSSCTIPCT